MSTNKEKYNTKIKDSFETKYKIFIFSLAVKDKFNLFQNNELNEFQKFILDTKIADKYSAEYKQLDYTDKLDGKVIEKIYENMRPYLEVIGNKPKNPSCHYSQYKKIYTQLFQDYKNNFNTIFKFENFENLIKNKICSYCSISEEQIALLGEKGQLHNKRSDTRGYTLEIDRIYPNLEYTEENCTMSCYWCNNAKTDEFLPEDFKEIAKGINIAWNLRFEKAGIKQKITFPTKSAIWTK